MHPMHALSSRESMHMQQQQQQQQQPINQDQDQIPTTMTVLESLNPAQQQQQHLNEQQPQVMGMIDPVQAQRQPHQQHLVQQHLVQQQQQQPHLHQLQPSQQTSDQPMIDEHQQQQQQQQQQHHQQQQQQQQRPQIISGEGIVADSGGPIVQWLLENYEIAEGESLPRSTVYNHYLAHCRQLQMASVNAASFGKLIRSVFVGLKTRRLGTRGHSKYHYFGVRAKQHVQHELIQHHESSAGCSRDNESSNHRTEDGESESDSTGMADCGRLSSSAGSAKRIKRSSSAALDRRAGHHLATANAAAAAAAAFQQHRTQHIEQHQHHHHHHHQQQQQQQPQQQQTVELASNGLYYATNNGVNNMTNGYTNCHPANNNNNGKISHNNIGGGNNINGNQMAAGSPTLEGCDLADFRNHLGANWTTLVDEHWPQREPCLLEQHLIKANGGQTEWSIYLELFESKYKSYYKRMVELLSELKFSEIEQLWQHFWHPIHQSDHWPTINETNNETSDQQQQNGHQQQQMDEFQQQQQQQQQVELTFHCLYQLTSQPSIVERINQIDYNLYAAIESFLLPDMLSPIPRLLTQQIRMFAKNIGPWIEIALKDYEPNFVAEKSKSARAFGYALRRYTSLNHLSTASRAIWEKRSSLAQMSMDLSRVDLRDIEHQVSLMSNKRADNLAAVNSNRLQPLSSALIGDKNEINQTNSDTGSNTSTPPVAAVADSTATAAAAVAATTTTTIPTTTNSTANDENTLIDENHHHHHLCAMQPGQLIQNFLHLLEDPYPANSWPDWCRNLVESRVCGLSLDEARNFVLKWNFYISLIMKELTLRSAPSFGSFQLIRLLFDEYIFYLVVTRLAQAQHKTPAQLLSS